MEGKQSSVWAAGGSAEGSRMALGVSITLRIGRSRLGRVNAGGCSDAACA